MTQKIKQNSTYTKNQSPLPLSMEDCYYFLYSLCTKKNCIYRHAPAAKENLILCKSWSKNRPCKIDCPFRHSDYHLKKDRKEIFCYWEETESGCQREFCNFKHKNIQKDEWKQVKIRNLEEIRRNTKTAMKNLENKNIENVIIESNFNNLNDNSNEKNFQSENKKNFKNISSDLQKELELIDKLLEEEGMSFSEDNFHQ